jgi:sulfate transport system ATP-binding protein
MSIEVSGIRKTFGQFTALNDLSLKIPDGELVALLGPSGSGKTTLLRIIAGLEVPDQGSILFSGQDATDQSVRERNVGFVFQHYALFKHMTVFENIAFGLRVRPRGKRPLEWEIKEKVQQLLRLVQMEPLAQRYPAQLSGGQRQRIALARALAVEPRVMLLDEPFGALDAKVRKELRRWIRQLHDEIHITSIFVTHDQDEALEVADRVVIMNEGRIEQIGTPEAVYDQPANAFVYQFLGNVNLFRGRVNNGKVRIDTEPSTDPSGESSTVAYARPHDLEIHRVIDGDQAAIQAVILHLRAIGPLVQLELKRLDTGEFIEAELAKERYRELHLQTGDKVFVELKNLKVFVEDFSI